MKALFFSFGRALTSQLTLRMLWLTLWPFFLATALWGGALWLILQPLIDLLQHYFFENDIYAISAKWLNFFGLAALKTFIVPLLAMWLLLPLIVVTALLFVSIMAMPSVVNYVGRQFYPALERRARGTFFSLLWLAISSVFVFILLWIITIPLCALPVVGFVIQPLLWGWLTCRLIAGEVFARYADKQEHAELLCKHRWPLLGIGTLTGMFGVAPSLLWFGGIWAVVFFPFFAALSIWLYVLIFTFSGLWFAHYCLAALNNQRFLSVNVQSSS